MLIRFAVTKRENAELTRINDKLIIHRGNWESDETHKKIKARILKRYPGWKILGYSKESR